MATLREQVQAAVMNGATPNRNVLWKHLAQALDIIAKEDTAARDIVFKWNGTDPIEWEIDGDYVRANGFWNGNELLKEYTEEGVFFINFVSTGGVNNGYMPAILFVKKADNGDIHHDLLLIVSGKPQFKTRKYKGTWEPWSNRYMDYIMSLERRIADIEDWKKNLAGE